MYKAFDTQEGREVAWNKVDLATIGSAVGDIDSTDQDRILAEIRVLKALKHKNIMSFYKWWYNEERRQINFISELFSSGTLRQYRKKHKHLGNEVLKHWAWQILCGLVYLHGHHPPIVHRDLKCDNIFINGADGVVKIGDLGLATMLHGRTAPQSVIGTPEFMAPELYDEYYDDRVDVYAFGMAMLELATLEYPYSECANAAQIYRKVSLGVRPAGLKKITCRELADFINTCIAPLEQRPRSRQLLKHPYFDSIRSTLHPSKSELLLNSALYASGDRPKAPMSGGSTTSFASAQYTVSRSVSQAGMDPAAGLEGSSLRHQKSNVSDLGSEIDNVRSQGSDETRPQSVYGSNNLSPVGSPVRASGFLSGQNNAKHGVCRCASTNRCFEFFGRYREDKEKRLLNLRLKIIEADGNQRTVEFEFDMDRDTATSVASEMVGLLELSPDDADAIALAMQTEIRNLLAELQGHESSSSLARAAAALQQQLRDTALLQANSEENSASFNQRTKEQENTRMMPSFESMASFHSIDSGLGAAPSLGATSSRSSPTKTHKSNASENQEVEINGNGMNRVNSADMFQKVHMLHNETPEVPRSSRASLDTVSSPQNGIMSPEISVKDMEKRSLSKLFANLQQVADLRTSTLTPPPPKPPLPPSGSKSSLCLSSPASLNGDLSDSPNDGKEELERVRSSDSLKNGMFLGRKFVSYVFLSSWRSIIVLDSMVRSVSFQLTLIF